MKHHGRGPPKYYEPQDRELDIHILESTAYRRLKERDLCDRGVIPHFFGTMRKFDPSSCQPHLRHFVEDEYPPSAIFMEYIPGLEMITLENYTEKRVANLLDAIRQIHKAFVRHKDVKPRNMMVVKDTPDRVIWLDFDRAETYDEDQITDEQVEGLKEEEQIMMEFSSFMVSTADSQMITHDNLSLPRPLIMQTGSLKKHILCTAPSHVFFIVQRSGKQHEMFILNNCIKKIET